MAPMIGLPGPCCIVPPLRGSGVERLPGSRLRKGSPLPMMILARPGVARNRLRPQDNGGLIDVKYFGGQSQAPERTRRRPGPVDPPHLKKVPGPLENAHEDLGNQKGDRVVRRQDPGNQKGDLVVRRHDGGQERSHPQEKPASGKGSDRSSQGYRGSNPGGWVWATVILVGGPTGGGTLPVGPASGESLPVGLAGGGSERNLEMDAISRNEFDFSLAFRDESRSGWLARHRYRDFARYPRRMSIPILGSLSSSTFVSRARNSPFVPRARKEAGEAPSHPCCESVRSSQGQVGGRLPERPDGFSRRLPRKGRTSGRSTSAPAVPRSRL